MRVAVEVVPARRALVLVIDGCGVGALPDAACYGDEGTNTLAHLARELGGLKLPADHGVDLSHPGTDRTREYVPLLAVSGRMLARRRAGAGFRGARHDGPLADVGATALRWLTGRDAQGLPGRAFIA